MHEPSSAQHATTRTGHVISAQKAPVESGRPPALRHAVGRRSSQAPFSKQQAIASGWQVVEAHSLPSAWETPSRPKQSIDRKSAHGVRDRFAGDTDFILSHVVYSFLYDKPRLCNSKNATERFIMVQNAALLLQTELDSI